MSPPALIGLDWGTTSFRAYLLAKDGTILDRRAAKAGILQLDGLGFEDVLRREAGVWLEAQPRLPILASGMIGSRQGWIEVPYRSCPAGSDELAANLVAHRLAGGGTIHFVPGMMVSGALPDVMRGEETELVGQLAADAPARLFVLPGTHCKWVSAAAGRIERFKTFMTGELFALLAEHSILGRLMAGRGHSEPGFTRGVQAGIDADASAGSLLHRLFSARTLPLVGELPADSVASYLSGLLIGSEIREAVAALGRTPVTLVGGGELVSHYTSALAIAGIATRSAAPEAAAHGLYAIATAAALIGARP